MNAAPAPETRWLRRWRTDILIALGAAVAILLAMMFHGILSPLALALAIAYILNPVMRWAARHRIPRGLTATILFLATLAAGVILVLLVVPPLVAQLYDFGVNLVGESRLEVEPGYVDLNGNNRLDEGYLPALLAYAEDLSKRLASGENTWYARVIKALGASSDTRADVLQAVTAAARTAGTGLLAFLGNLPGLVTDVALTAFYLFFFLMNFERMIKAVRTRLPGRYRGRIIKVTGEIDQAISAFLRGRIIVCLIIGVLTAIGLAIAGVPYWFLIGFVTGLSGIVPFLPLFVGLIPAMLVGWFDTQSGWPVLGAVIVFVVVQTLDGWVFTPLVQGKAVGLHPVTQTVALLVGYELLGFFGLVAAIPLAATIKILAREFLLPKVEELAREKPDSGP